MIQIPYSSPRLSTDSTTSLTPNDDDDEDEEMKEMMEDFDYMDDEELEEELANRRKHDSGAMEDQDSLFSMEDSNASSLDMDSDDFASGGGGGGGGGPSSMSASFAAHLKRGGGVSGGGIFDHISHFKSSRDSANSSPTTMMERKMSTVKLLQKKKTD